MAENQLIIPEKKYRGETAVVSARLPKSMIEDLDQEAGRTGYNRNEITGKRRMSHDQSHQPEEDYWLRDSAYDKLACQSGQLFSIFRAFQRAFHQPPFKYIPSGKGLFPGCYADAGHEPAVLQKTAAPADIMAHLLSV